MLVIFLPASAYTSGNCGVVGLEFLSAVSMKRLLSSGM